MLKFAVYIFCSIYIKIKSLFDDGLNNPESNNK